MRTPQRLFARVNPRFPFLLAPLLFCTLSLPALAEPVFHADPDDFEKSDKSSGQLSGGGNVQPASFLDAGGPGHKQPGILSALGTTGSGAPKFIEATDGRHFSRRSGSSGSSGMGNSGSSGGGRGFFSGHGLANVPQPAGAIQIGPGALAGGTSLNVTVPTGTLAQNPEPSSVILAIVGLSSLAGYRWSRRRRTQNPSAGATGTNATGGDSGGPR